MIIKETLVAATSDDTVYSKSVSGFAMRVLKCPWTEEWATPEAPRILNSPYQMLLSSDYIQAANDHRRADLMFEAAGQGVSFIDSMKPAKQIVNDMVEEALSVFEQITGESADA
jgi:NAD(P)H-dependent flavin oxidoreductase YrpB (nitropropane dioxygenase family)